MPDRIKKEGGQLKAYELTKLRGLRALCLCDGEREISSCYIGDLLSWVMGRAKEDAAWITIMSNANVVAVATLADVGAVILAEGVIPDGEIVTLAEQKGVNLFVSDMPAYESALALSELLS